MKLGLKGFGLKHLAVIGAMAGAPLGIYLAPKAQTLSHNNNELRAAFRPITEGFRQDALSQRASLDYSGKTYSDGDDEIIANYGGFLDPWVEERDSLEAYLKAQGVKQTHCYIWTNGAGDVRTRLPLSLNASSDDNIAERVNDYHKERAAKWQTAKSDDAPK